MKNIPRLIPIWFWVVLTVLIAFTANTCYAQQARPTYNPFNNTGIPFYGGNQIRPQFGYQQPNIWQQQNSWQRPQYGYQRPNNWQRPQQNNWQRPQYGYQQNNWQRPQQNNWQQPQQNNWQQPQPQQPQTQPQQPQTQPQPPMFTRTFTLNNGYMFGQRTLYFDPKTGKAQPWVRKNLR